MSYINTIKGLLYIELGVSLDLISNVVGVHLKYKIQIR